MSELKCRTRGDSLPNGKPRVYFTCHPADFQRYFDKICEDIFKTHDCAIYYTGDMQEPIAQEDLETLLGRNNLFVVPVTFRLLMSPNRAMDADIAYAKQQHIPILPVMMETGIDSIYARPDKFGELQYLSPNSRDLTEISYEEKLRKHLESVLVSDETARRIRDAFDAYIFLSYRKKDRRYANELMRLIHRKEEFRDVAIWYDEFLTPGESFRENIFRILSDSKLFALLVTPSLLEEPNGQPNFVMGQEYPMAREAGMDILPAEMKTTDKEALAEKFTGIPACVDPHNEEAFRARMLESLSRIARTKSDEDPEHNFLIGLAYLEGIDVEVDRSRGLSLITSAAEAELPEAMEKLCDMYFYGHDVALDYRKAIDWAEHLLQYRTRQCGPEDLRTLQVMSQLAYAYGISGDYKMDLQLQEKLYTLYRKNLGETNWQTLQTLCNLAYLHNLLGIYPQALELGKQAHQQMRHALGSEDPATITALHNLAAIYGAMGNDSKALELNQKVYGLRCKVLGKKHPESIISLNNMAHNHRCLGHYPKALELQKEAYDLTCKVLGQEHPQTLSALGNLAYSYSCLGNKEKALELGEQTYAARCRLLGEAHPDTLVTLNNLSCTHRELGHYPEALELGEQAYQSCCNILGEDHPDTLISLNNLATTYSSMQEYPKALELNQKGYTLRSKKLGKTHPKTIRALNNLVVTHSALGHYPQAQELGEQACQLCSRYLGEEHPDTQTALQNLSMIYGALGNYPKALELGKKIDALKKKRKK